MKLAIFATIVASASAWAPQLKKVDFAQVSSEYYNVIFDAWQLFVNVECTDLTHCMECLFACFLSFNLRHV